MNTTIKALCKGVAVSAVSMIIALAGVGFYSALMLLVIAMEEGGENLTVHALPFAEAALLLAQGVGFEVGSFKLTITPLLLTALIIGMIRAFTVRWGVSRPSLVGGMLSWAVLTMILASGVEVQLTDAMWLVIVKSMGVFLCGYALALPSASTAMTTVRARLHDAIGAPVRRILRICLTGWLGITAVYLVFAVVTAVIWIILNHGTVGELFTLSDMQIGSRILTTFACIIWLPNICLWALSWLFGAGFSIGDVAAFSLWTSHADGLPAVPVFGIFPNAVDDDPIRIMLMMIPFITGLTIGMLTMLLPQGFAIRPPLQQQLDHRLMLRVFAGSALSLCATAALVSATFALAFACSNGALGQQRLARVGVNVIQSTRTVGQSTGLGLLAAWLLVLVGVYAVFGLRWARERYLRAHTNRSASEGDATERKSTITPRVVNSTSTLKEEQGDNNEPTD